MPGGVESDYAGAPYDVVVRADVVVRPGGACPDVPHIEQAMDEGLRLGEGLTCWAARSLQGRDGEALRESASEVEPCPLLPC